MRSRIQASHLNEAGQGGPGARSLRALFASFS